MYMEIPNCVPLFFYFLLFSSSIIIPVQTHIIVESTIVPIITMSPILVALGLIIITRNMNNIVEKIPPIIPYLSGFTFIPPHYI